MSPSGPGEGADVPGDPFTALGLPVRAGLTDEDVRAAWRRIAAATHPDREDGGDAARYSAAAAAYDTLRTSFGRGEALADLAGGGRHVGGRHVGGRQRTRRRFPWNLLSRGLFPVGLSPGSRFLGRGLAFPVAGGAVAVLAVAVVGWTPASIALLAGAATWLVAWRVRRP